MTEEKILTDGKEPVNKKPIMFLGRDLRKVKCFRDSFIFGICGGVLGGLGCFMWTSKALFSSHFAFGSLWVCVWGYWLPCRYKHETEVLKVEHWKKTLKAEKENQMQS